MAKRGLSFFPYFIDQSEAKSYKKWTNISMEESLLNLKSWPSDCRFHIRTAANYSSETTVGFCPSWVGSEEPRTYIMLRNPSPNIYLSGHLKDFAEHPLFTSWKGGRDSYFANPVIKSGQETKCVFDSKCWFRRIEFSVKGKQCQWVYYHPDYVPTTGQVADTEVMRSATPYALEINGTPGFVIGNRLVPGAIDTQTMQQIVEAERAAAKPRK